MNRLTITSRFVEKNVERPEQRQVLVLRGKVKQKANSAPDTTSYTYLHGLGVCLNVCVCEEDSLTDLRCVAPALGVFHK